MPGSNHSDSDLNKDGKIDMQDLKIVQMNYRIVSSDPRWTDISKCDVNHDNVVDIQDLTDIMLKFA